ncbi:MAG: dihydrofolate synthase / folylpolyglutamate synthase [Bacteroidales bacterium]|nr:dihydrofolate synthase / folylpolyglutamate synthase [Bacteroidales bacterium]
MNYNEAVEYIFSHLPMFTRIGGAAYKADLSRTLALCEAAGNPHKFFKSIHVGGTNGKGSVSSFLASVFMEHGLKTGIFTSPHLRDFRERIKVNGEMISQDFVAEYITRFRPVFDSISPSFFEMSFALAAEYFKVRQVEIAIVEVGMGGRLDSTNVISPEISVITNIGNDHKQFLGDTLPKIAIEKAGIIKPGIPVVIGEHQTETDFVFIEQSRQKGAPLFFAADFYTLTDVNDYGAFLELTCQNIIRGCLVKVKSPLRGIYQQKNIITALAALEVLTGRGYAFDKQKVIAGFQNVVENTGLAGRWHILGKHPLVVADIAHNEPGIKILMEQVKNQHFHRLHFVLGMVADKDSAHILPLLPPDAVYYFCRPNIPRGKDALLLAEECAQFGLSGEVFDSVEDAFQAAQMKATPNDMILISGSAFAVAEVI